MLRARDRVAAYQRDAALAYLALSRRDTARAIRYFSRLADTLCLSCGRDRIMTARLHAAVGQDRIAAKILESRWPTLLSIGEISSWVELGPVLQRLGRHDEAAAVTRRVAEAWGRGDPEARAAALVFPSEENPAEPRPRITFGKWWKRAETLAQLKPVKGRGYHSLRRQFATELKDAPLKDLAYLGGWKDAKTRLTCYQQPTKVRSDGRSNRGEGSRLAVSSKRPRNQLTPGPDTQVLERAENRDPTQRLTPSGIDGWGGIRTLVTLLT